MGLCEDGGQAGVHRETQQMSEQKVGNVRDSTYLPRDEPVWAHSVGTDGAVSVGTTNGTSARLSVFSW